MNFCVYYNFQIEIDILGASHLGSTERQDIIDA